MKICRSVAVSVIFCYGGLCFSGCMKTVKRYRTETQPRVETRYREVEKPVTNEVQVPYEKEVKVPRYKMVRAPRINRARKKMKVAVLPFKPVFPATENNGVQVMNLVKGEIRRNDRAGAVFEFVSNNAIFRSLGISSLQELTRENVKSLYEKFNIQLLISGNVKKWLENEGAINLDVTSLASMKRIFRSNSSGNKSELQNWVRDLFFGKTVRSGTEKKMVTEYRTEKQTVMEKVQEPYEVTVYKEVRVPYETKTLDWSTTFWGGVLVYAIIKAMAKSDK